MLFKNFDYKYNNKLKNVIFNTKRLPFERIILENFHCLMRFVIQNELLTEWQLKQRKLATKREALYERPFETNRNNIVINIIKIQAICDFFLNGTHQNQRKYGQWRQCCCYFGCYKS